MTTIFDHHHLRPPLPSSTTTTFFNHHHHCDDYALLSVPLPVNTSVTWSHKCSHSHPRRNSTFSQRKRRHNREEIWDPKLDRGSIVSFYFFIIFTHIWINLYSNGLHVSHGGPLHYTIFAFVKRGGALHQRWAMHVDEDGFSTYVASRKRKIYWGDITRL